MSNCHGATRAPPANLRAVRGLRVERLGRVPYREGLKVQAARHQAIADGTLDDTLLLLEHDPVITLGRSGNADNVLADAETLAARGIEVVHTGRGGDVTYHGPGQLVAYPIVALQDGERDVRAWVYKLEELVLRTVAAFGVEAERVDGLRGLWVGRDKVAAVGIRLMRWVSCHGLALNVHTDLDDFATIVPCGLHGRGVTSVARLVAPAPSLEDVMDEMVRQAGDVLGRRVQSAASSRPAPAQDARARLAAAALLL